MIVSPSPKKTLLKWEQEKEKEKEEEEECGEEETLQKKKWVGEGVLSGQENSTNFSKKKSWWKWTNGYNWLKRAIVQNMHKSCCRDAHKNYKEAQSTKLSRAKWGTDSEVF